MKKTKVSSCCGVGMHWSDGIILACEKCGKECTPVSTNMEHTYIEQEFGIHLKDLSEHDRKKVIDIATRLTSQVRTETLMECRGLMPELTKEDRAFIKEEDPRYMGEWGVLAERDRMFAAIDTLIKKETV